MGGLYASPPEPLAFGHSLERRGFLLRRERGNLLVYSIGTLEDEVEAIEDLSGISRQYLNHRHEGAPVCDWVAETFGAPGASAFLWDDGGIATCSPATPFCCETADGPRSSSATAIARTTSRASS